MKIYFEEGHQVGDKIRNIMTAAAEKINTPILFMHGTVDNNVPMGESIQMFNALKILGKETAFIMVDGENHYIADHHKRIRWHDSIMAWFQKWLQDDPTWWNDMYPEKNL